MHCLSRKASYALFIHGFNRRRILLVFLNSEAVFRSGVLYIEYELRFNSTPVLGKKNNAGDGT